MKKFSIAVLNPGSTSTKMALYRNGDCLSSETIRHETDELRQFETIWDQFDFRMEKALAWLKSKQDGIDAIAGIGGLLRPLASGTYRVNDAMLSDARANLQGEHASNLGCAMAAAAAREYSCSAFVVDPVSVDEFTPVARYSGHPLLERKTLSHALNIRSAAYRASAELKRRFEETSFVIAHLGGGISVAAVKNGKIIDVNDASSDGPFSPERTGGLPLQQFISLCFSEKYSEREMRSLVMGKGGLTAYLGTNSLQKAEEMVKNGDQRAGETADAMAYQIAKEIGAMTAALEGTSDAVVLTGGMASSAWFAEKIVSRVQFLGKIFVFPGEDEMRAMAEGVLRVLKNEETAKEY